MRGGEPQPQHIWPMICHRCDQPIGEGEPTALEMGTSGFFVHAHCPVPPAEQRAVETMLRVSLQDLKDLGLSVATRQWCYERDPARQQEMARLTRLFERIWRSRSELEARLQQQP